MGYFVFFSRYNMLKESGFDLKKILEYCNDSNDIDNSIGQFITSMYESDLRTNYPLSYQIMNENISDSRLHGRSKFETVRDISIDGLVSKIIIHTIQNEKDIGFYITENDQDKYLSIVKKTSITPDFIVQYNNEKNYIEMKMGGNRRNEDEYNRSVWTNKTITIRQKDVERELLRYSRLEYKDKIYFLRINPDIHQFSITKLTNYMQSKKNDGTFFAYHVPVNYINLYDLSIKIKEEIKKEINKNGKSKSYK